MIVRDDPFLNGDRPESMDSLKGGEGESWITPTGKIVLPPKDTYMHHEELIGKHGFNTRSAIESGWTRVTIDRNNSIGFQTRDLKNSKMLEFIEFYLLNASLRNPDITDIYVDIDRPVIEQVHFTKSDVDKSNFKDVLEHEYEKVTAPKRAQLKRLEESVEAGYKELVKSLQDLTPIEVLLKLEALKKSLSNAEFNNLAIVDELPLYQELMLSSSAFRKAVPEELLSTSGKWIPNNRKYASNEAFINAIGNFEKTNLSHFNFKLPENSIKDANAPLGNQWAWRDHQDRLGDLRHISERINIYEINPEIIKYGLEKGFKGTIRQEVFDLPPTGKISPDMRSYSRPELKRPVETPKTEPARMVEVPKIIKSIEVPKPRGLKGLSDISPEAATRFVIFLNKSANKFQSARPEDEADIFWDTLRGRDAFERYAEGTLPERDFVALLNSFEDEESLNWPLILGVGAAATAAALLYFYFKKK